MTESTKRRSREVLKRPEPDTKLDWHAILLLMLSLFAWASLLTPDFFLQAHDARHALFFPMEFHSGVLDGYLLPRWSPDIAFGYGYPLFVFYSPLVFYVTEAFRLVGLGASAATKATFALGFVMGGLAMYHLARRYVGRNGALLAGLLYTYLPYHFVDVYVRAALAESFALVLLPLLLLTFHDLLQRPSPRRAAYAAASYGALVLTHNVTALIFTAIVALYGLLLIAGRPARHSRLVLFGWAALSGVLGLALSAVFWLPNLVEQRYIELSQWTAPGYNFRLHFVHPGQLISSFWGFGYSVAGASDRMSFQIGLVAVALMLLLVIGWQQVRRRVRLEIAFFGLLGVVLVAAMLPVAGPLWDAFPVAPLIQFPWRLLAPLGVCAALLGGVAADTWLLADRRDAGVAVVAMAMIVVVASHPYAEPQYTPPNERQETPRVFLDFERQHLDMVGMMSWSQEQPRTSPVEVQMEAGEVPQKIEALSPDAQVTLTRYRGSSLAADVRSPHGTSARVLIYDYPGWKAWVDGQEVAIHRVPPLGLMEVDVPAGQHHLSLRFTDTPLRKGAWGISLLGLALVAAMFWRDRHGDGKA